MRVIYCAAGQERIILDIICLAVEAGGVVFADGPALHGESVADRAVVGGLDDLPTSEDSRGNRRFW